MNRNLVEIALQELEAEDRALLELSVVRGVSDADIAELLGVDVARVLIKREEALGRVSALIGDDPEHVIRTMRDLPDARWRHEEPEPEPEPEPESEPEWEPEPEWDPEPEPEPEAEAEPEPAKPDDQGRFMLVLLGALAVTLVVVVFLALSGDDEEAVPEPAPTTAEAPAGRVAIEPLAGGRGSGSARIQGGRLSLQVRGLPAGGYVIWLYNSVTDASPLAGRRQGSFGVDAKLPAGYRRYRFIDVSREPSDGNRNHSGQSVLRVATARLR